MVSLISVDKSESALSILSSTCVIRRTEKRQKLKKLKLRNIKTHPTHYQIQIQIQSHHSIFLPSFSHHKTQTKQNIFETLNQNSILTHRDKTTQQPSLFSALRVFETPPNATIKKASLINFTHSL